MSQLKKYDRVILMLDFKSGNNIIPAGTIGTYRQTINDTMVIQTGFIDNVVRLVGLPDSILQIVSVDALRQVDNPQLLLPAIYHIGNYWQVPTGYIDNKMQYKTGKIIGIKLSLNESYDKIMLAFQDNTEKEYEKRFLEDLGCYSSCDLPEYVPGIIKDKGEE